MRVALYQGPEQAGTKADMLARMAAEAMRAASDGADLLVLPEMFLTGYHIGAEAVRAGAEASDGSSAARAAEIARAAGLALVYGYPELGADGAIYNAALLIGRDGTPRANYRKTHLFGALDKAVFSAGGAPVVTAEICGLRVGLLICYDVEFPEMVRGLALAGADLVVVPTALMQPYDFVPRGLIAARAFENGLYVAYANRAGQERELIYTGLSCIAAPDGRLVAQAGTGEGACAATLDRELLAAARKLNTYLADRRPDLYTGLTT